VRLIVEGRGTGEGPVLNIQLEAGGKRYRDYYLDVDSNGAKTVILAEPGTSRMLAEFPPAYSNYAFKSAMTGFDYGNVVALNLRWMRYPKGSDLRCRISLVEALEERNGVLTGIDISVGALNVAIPGEMKTGDYAEYWADGLLRVFDRNGLLLLTVPANRGPLLRAGDNRLALTAAGPGNAVFTAITLGK
jgi:hypothetical protein